MELPNLQYNNPNLQQQCEFSMCSRVYGIVLQLHCTEPYAMVRTTTWRAETWAAAAKKPQNCLKCTQCIHHTIQSALQFNPTPAFDEGLGLWTFLYAGNLSSRSWGSDN